MAVPRRFVESFRVVGSIVHVRDLQRIELAFAAFGLATPLPGAPDFEDFRKGVDLESFDWSTLSYFRARDTERIPAERLQALLRAAVMRFYLRPHRLWKLARSVRARQVPYLANGVYRYLTGKSGWRPSSTAHF